MVWEHWSEPQQRHYPQSLSRLPASKNAIRIAIRVILNSLSKQASFNNRLHNHYPSITSQEDFIIARAVKIRVHLGERKQKRRSKLLYMRTTKTSMNKVNMKMKSKTLNLKIRRHHRSDGFIIDD